MTSTLPPQPRIVLAGSVVSSRRTLQALLRYRANVVGVLGVSEEVAGKVSGYARLDDLAEAANVPYMDFRNVNEPEVVEAVRAWKPDLFFVVGLSQLVKQELLSVPTMGSVGFHPTWLPKGRGRAPVAWLVLERRPGAATFFLMNEGVDAGPILAQEPFDVAEQDYAIDVIEKMERAIDAALDRWIPRLLAGEWNPIPQDDALATYNARRAPEDGLVDWSRPADEIHTLVRASSRPHPGAYTYARGHKLIIWRAELAPGVPHQGVSGRVLHNDEARGWLVQTGQGLLWLTDVEFEGAQHSTPPPALRVGIKLGYSPQDEIHTLRQRLAELEERLAQRERETDRRYG